MRVLDLQTFLFLFLVCFPLSVYLWSVLLVGGGFVRSIPEMPWEFRLAARITGAKRSEGFAAMAVAGPLVLLAIINSPVLFAIAGPYGLIGFLAAVSYVAVQLLWLARIRRAIRRIGQ